jgi:hypothetical protein
MPIIEFATRAEDVPPGVSATFTKDYQTGTDIWTWPTHVGLCLRDRERNGYDDSDFYMLVWDPVAKEAKEICFATTRGWTYPSYGSSVDATPEVRAEYAAWQKKMERRAKAQRILGWRKDRRAYAQKCGITVFQVDALLLAITGVKIPAFYFGRATGHYATFEAMMKLLATRKFRSDFRASMAAQVRSWLGESSHKYATPLSPRQLSYLN